MSYVNFGSNWGGKSANNNLLDIFKKYSVVFFGLDDVNRVKKYLSYNYEIGTKIIVTDGKKNIAVAVSTSKFNSLDKLNIHFEKEDKKRFGINGTVLAVKVKLFELDEYDKNFDFFPARPNRFCNIKNEKDKNHIDKLLKKYSGELAMEEYVKLLKENYNLILTGAPGTGKTYLAKEIAAKIIFDDDKKEYTEELEEDDNFKNQCKFVQFHPSYDYTDFVEGLRPINNNGNIGFERKDGVFKEFCKRALKNLVDIEYSDSIIKNYLIEFSNEIYNDFKKNNKLVLEGISGEPVAEYINIVFNEKEETLLMKAKSKHEYTINGKMHQYLEWYKIYKKQKENGSLTTANMEKAVGFAGRITYLCAFLHSFDKKYNSKIKIIEKKNFVFIIDEINRGEISKIFGELFFAIDPGYRGEKGRVKTQYNNLINNDESNEDDEFEDGFFVPENVYIIGTMNDIDRSVESMDFAMRRRFAWKEVKAIDTQEDILKDLDDSIKQDAIDRMDALNKAIYDEEKKTSICELSSAYHIGASYLLKLKNYYKSSSDNKETAFKSLWENHLKGLLFEYLRGMPNINDKLKKLENAYNMLSDNNTKQDTNIDN